MEGRLKEIFDGGTVDSLTATLKDAQVVIPKGAKKQDLAELVLKLETGEELEKIGDAEANAELPWLQLAESLFNENPKLNVLYITRDGQAFAGEEQAHGHSMGYDKYTRPGSTHAIPLGQASSPSLDGSVEE